MVAAITIIITPWSLISDLWSLVFGWIQPIPTIFGIGCISLLHGFVIDTAAYAAAAQLAWLDAPSCAPETKYSDKDTLVKESRDRLSASAHSGAPPPQPKMVSNRLTKT